MSACEALVQFAPAYVDGLIEGLTAETGFFTLGTDLPGELIDSPTAGGPGDRLVDAIGRAGEGGAWNATLTLGETTTNVDATFLGLRY